jgi:hypothetical protein
MATDSVSASLLEVAMPLNAQRSTLPRLFGAILVTAALLKTESLITEPTPWFWPIACLIEIELFVGTCLVLGVFPRVIRWIAMCLFAAFSVASCFHLIAGTQSCGCLGRLADPSPWLALVVDLLGVLCLWRWSPKQSPYGRPHWFGTMLSTIGCLAILPFFIRAETPPVFPQLRAPTAIELGELPQDAGMKIPLILKNSHEEPVTVDRLDTTCPCVFADELPWLVPPGKEVQVLLHLDLRREPGFSGRLSIRCSGRTATGTSTFTLRVNVKVI